jgi:DNA (cytosine-5)-methyltransferase 1
MDLGFHRAGFEHVAFCEADPYRREVIARHWPGVPVYDDVRTFDYEGQVDCLVGGFPCQDLSVAGKRAGLAGERSGLFYDAMRIADRVVRPGGFLVLENVAGLLSSNEGRDFAIVLRSLADLGFAQPAWRMLDSQFFNVPQRRRRIFVVACRSESDVSKEVLALTEGSGRDIEASRKTGSSDPGTTERRASKVGVDITQSLTTRFGNSGADLPDAEAGLLVAGYPDPAGPITKRHGSGVNTTMDDGAMVVSTVTRKWAKGSGGYAGDECQNLVVSDG